MSDFKAKMHQIRFRLGSAPDPLAGFKGDLLLRGGRGRMGGEGKGEREGRKESGKRKGEGGTKGKGGGGAREGKAFP